MQYILEIPGKPLGKQRHRSGKFGSYTPKKTVDFEHYIQLLWVSKYGNHLIDAPGFEIVAYCCFLPPKSTSKKKLELMLNGEMLYVKKPDYDNLAKIVGDALNGIAWRDDSMIVHGDVWKLYRPYQSIKIEINTITKISPALIENIDNLAG